MTPRRLEGIGRVIWVPVVLIVLLLITDAVQSGLGPSVIQWSRTP